MLYKVKKFHLTVQFTSPTFSEMTYSTVARNGEKLFQRLGVGDLLQIIVSGQLDVQNV